MKQPLNGLEFEVFFFNFLSSAAHRSAMCTVHTQRCVFDTNNWKWELAKHQSVRSNPIEIQIWHFHRHSMQRHTATATTELCKDDIRNELKSWESTMSTLCAGEDFRRKSQTAALSSTLIEFDGAELMQLVNKIAFNSLFHTLSSCSCSCWD